MEESVNWQFDVYMQEMFHMKEVDIREYSPLTLAYIGDCIYDVIIKSLVVNEGNQSVNVPVSYTHLTLPTTPYV